MDGKLTTYEIVTGTKELSGEFTCGKVAAVHDRDRECRWCAKLLDDYYLIHATSKVRVCSTNCADKYIDEQLQEL